MLFIYQGMGKYRQEKGFLYILMCKFQSIWTKIEVAGTFGVKYLKILILSDFYKRSYQNRKLQKAITFERKLIRTLCKKPLFPLIFIFYIRSILIF